MTSLRPFSPLCALLAALLATACGGGTFGDAPLDPNDPRRENGFESDNPLGPNATSRGDSGSDDGALGGGNSSSGGAEPSAPPTDTGGEAERAIEEADIVKVEGQILFALSRYGGLTTIDVSDPARLRLLGRARLQGTPFEMYVRDGRAYVMLNEFGRWVSTTNDAGLEVGGSWQQTSELVALDVSNPRAISEVAHYDIPGTVADSRLVGDAMYVVTYENGYCWGCEQNAPGTVVTSFLLQGSSIRKVRQLPFRAANNSYSYQRSVSATNERLYIGGPDWSWNGNGNDSRSVIQVVDIANPAGDMSLGDTVTVAGQINSRWQMDEHAGVLRVVSQPWDWNVNPKVETFTIHSSSHLSPLGSGQLQLPKPESLRSVRFDGARGYAITAEQTDPLFTIDLSDPAHPRQAGELEMPGWITHMEPRGDRLIGFGFADTNGSSKLAVSLFDVSDLSTPVMLDRVEFGGGGGNSYAEDQDRIHKSVQVLTDKGLVLVPFASYRSWNNDGCTDSRSGIQLIDFSRDDLTLRGLAPQYGASRRSFFVGDKLLAMGDRNVTAFDVSSRDNPVKLSETDLANPAYQIQRVGNYVASISNDWWTEEATLSLTPYEGADDAAVTGRLDLGAMIRGTAESCQVGASQWTSWYNARIVPLTATTLAVAVPTYWYNRPNANGSGASYGQRLLIGSFDLSDPKAPRLTATQTIEQPNSSYYGYGYGFADGYGYYGYYGGRLLGTGDAVVAIDQKLAYLGVSYVPTSFDQYGSPTDYRLERKLHVVDYSDVNHPVQHPPLVLGESLGQFPLHVQGSQVLTSRWMASNTPGKVRFYIDRIDLAGTVPQRLPSINVPGSLLSIDPQSGRAVTTDYREISFDAPADDSYGYGYGSCWNYGGISWYDEASGRCKHIERQFKLLELGADGQNVAVLSQYTPNSRRLSGVLATGSTIYLTRYPEYSYGSGGSVAGSSGGVIGEAAPAPTLVSPGGFDVLTGVRDGNLRPIASHNSGDNWTWPLAANDQHVAMYTQSGITVYASNEGTPRIAAKAELNGAGYSSDVLLSQDRALCSLGEWGLQTIPLQ